ncbi:hypothetical protein LWI29_027291 [Acer saccharum]|uniref:Protein NRT1/ PTR FAMILY 1.2-like n=1 Tax=Acer saccharum TaxID=4024 RepID=A0AA39W0J1_ACESA|nr:hypothetical protein LWI29_027291 [Acer saccharum]
MDEKLNNPFRSKRKHGPTTAAATLSQEGRKGGMITMPFIIANEAFEKVASYGLVSNMILYLMREYHIGAAKGSNILFFWSAATNFMPTLGAIIGDSYLGKFLAISLGSVFSFMGILLLWITAMIPQFRPPSCVQFSPSCKPASSSQMAILLSSFALMSIGAGGVRPCSLAFGADQFNRRDDPNNDRVLESFFGWYYASAAVSVLIAFTGIVYIQDHLGWKVGFGVPAILMFLSAILFIIASPFYVKMKTTGNIMTGFVQVIVVSFKNRKLSLPPRDSSGGWYHQRKGSELILPTDNLRCLNKACIIRNPDQDISPDGSALNPWSLCTIDRVEELKVLIRVMPLWSTGIIMSLIVSQNTFPILQAGSMNRHIGSFEFPAGSFGMFTIISLFIWVFFYERVILPLASKIVGKPVRLGTKLRMGMGLFFSCMSMVASGSVESIRRRKAVQEGFTNNPQGVLSMSAFWLVPQHCFTGLAEAMNSIGQTEFYYSEFPKSMSSIASSLFGLAMALASLLATVIISTIDNATSKGGKESWVSSNINKAHYDYYYWLLAILCFLNLLYFFVCSWAYGPCKKLVVTDARNEPNGSNDEEEQELITLGNKFVDEENGFKENGLKENGMKENGLKENGPGMKENGLKVNGLKEEEGLSKSKDLNA